MNSNNSDDKPKKESDMSQNDIAISGSEVDEQQVPADELVTVYPGTDQDGENQNG